MQQWPACGSGRQAAVAGRRQAIKSQRRAAVPVERARLPLTDHLWVKTRPKLKLAQRYSIGAAARNGAPAASCTAKNSPPLPGPEAAIFGC
jgi:hypothetical protein